MAVFENSLAVIECDIIIIAEKSSELYNDTANKNTYILAENFIIIDNYLVCSVRCVYFLIIP
jgi:hypothetical protein